jgi:hypothetical protein
VSGKITDDWQRRLVDEHRYRQSLLAAFETCPRRTFHSLTLADDLSVGWVEESAEIGSAGHAVFAEIVRTLYRRGEIQMSTQEAVEIMYEVLAGGDWVLSADGRQALLEVTLPFAGVKWPLQRIMLIEGALPYEPAGSGQPLRHGIVCPDGVTRTLTGTPDLLVSDPPAGIVVIDYKTGWGVPRTPKKPPPEGEPIRGKEFLSQRGHFQLDVYGLLALKRYPSAQYVTLRELHLRKGDVREATLGREELEHVERELGLQMMLLERGAREGQTAKVWKPRPGHHCLKQCPVSRSCPVPQAHRGVGAVRNRADADRQAARAATVVKAVYTQLRERLKAFHEADRLLPAGGRREGVALERSRLGEGPVVRHARGARAGRTTAGRRRVDVG